MKPLTDRLAKIWKESEKTPKKQQFVVVLLVGILLLAAAMPVKEKQTETSNNKAAKGGIKKQTKDYGEAMEERLSKTLSKVSGVGENTVMITLKSTAEKVVEKDEDQEENRISEETVYEEEDNNQVPYVKKEMTPKIEGVVVIAEGGDDPFVAQNIIEAVQALFDVDTHKIKIMKMNE